MMPRHKQSIQNIKDTLFKPFKTKTKVEIANVIGKLTCPIKDLQDTRSRRFIIINERETNFTQGFYESTGANSGLPGTWLPFYGLNIDDTNQFVLGHIFKKLDLTQGRPIFHQMEKIALEHYLAIMSPRDGLHFRDLVQRSYSLANLLISYKIGGGVWDMPQFNSFKEYLSQKYSSALGKLPQYVICDNDEPKFDVTLSLVNKNEDLPQLITINKILNGYNMRLNQEVKSIISEIPDAPLEQTSSYTNHY